MRIRLSGFIGLLVIVVVLPAFNGCVNLQKSDGMQKKQLVLPQAGDDVKGMIAEIGNDSESPLASEELLQLSFLYSHTLNSEPDYKKSLEMLNKYMKTTPGQMQFESAGHISSLLEKIIRQGQAIQKMRFALKKEVAEKKQLAEENRGLKKKITGLKKLDIRLEKQRLGVN